MFTYGELEMLYFALSEKYNNESKKYEEQNTKGRHKAKYKLSMLEEIADLQHKIFMMQQNY